MGQYAHVYPRHLGVLIASGDGPDGYQARLTFAMARHAAVDLAMVMQTPPLPPQPARLSEDGFAQLFANLRRSGVQLRDEKKAAMTLAELRGMYEPFVNALAEHFYFALPPFQPEKLPVDNWQTNAWTPRTPDLDSLSRIGADEDHFG